MNRLVRSSTVLLTVLAACKSDPRLGLLPSKSRGVPTARASSSPEDSSSPSPSSLSSFQPLLEGRKYRVQVVSQGPGSELMTHAATSFIREHPPSRPCVAEYGGDFPRYLGAHPAAESLPYLTQFADLEWHLGRLALATEESTNVQYIHLGWALDELIGLYLTDTAPDEYTLRQEDVWLEIRGLRGELQMNRLTAEQFAGRAAAQPTGDRL